MRISRRHILNAGVIAFLAPLLRVINRASSRPTYDKNIIRPLGALGEDDFLARCIRCRACANVCEAGCIKFFTLADSPVLAGTPYLSLRQRACNLCTNCTQVCPTGALTPISRDIEDIKNKAQMGTAIVNEEHCLSFNGRVCGICRDACPIGGEAIKLEVPARPVIIKDACIGCGRCEERCPQFPTAIKIVRNEKND